MNLTVKSIKFNKLVREEKTIPWQILSVLECNHVSMWNGADWNWFRLHLHCPDISIALNHGFCHAVSAKLPFGPVGLEGHFPGSRIFVFLRGTGPWCAPQRDMGRGKPKIRRSVEVDPGGGQQSTALHEPIESASWLGHSAQAFLGPLGARSHDPFSFFGNQTLIFFFPLFFSPASENWW